MYLTLMAYISNELGNDFQQGGFLYKQPVTFNGLSSMYSCRSDRPQKQASE